VHAQPVGPRRATSAGQVGRPGQGLKRPDGGAPSRMLSQYPPRRPVSRQAEDVGSRIAAEAKVLCHASRDMAQRAGTNPTPLQLHLPAGDLPPQHDVAVSLWTRRKVGCEGERPLRINGGDGGVDALRCHPDHAASSARSAGVAGRLATSATGSGSRCAAAGEATAAVATTARRTTSERLIGPPALRSAGRLLVLVEPTLNAEGVESTSESVLYRD
jgi:hypothetical protein